MTRQRVMKKLLGENEKLVSHQQQKKSYFRESARKKLSKLCCGFLRKHVQPTE